MKPRRALLALTGLGVSALAMTLGTAGAPEASAASAAPNYQMPFRCGYTATAATWADHNPQLAVDFQKDGIQGDAVLASAPGTVSVVADEGNESYGKWIQINHKGPHSTRYAHLSVQSVDEGERVSQGEKIGEAGHTGGVPAHLHYEQRTNDHAVKVTLNGRDVPYYEHTSFTSHNNCGGGGGNPYTAKEVCGNGFSVIDSAKLGKAGKVYLLYDSSSGKNCVTTLKHNKVGKATQTSAFLKVKGGKRHADSGDFKYYAGPVKAEAKATCVKWGGSARSKEYSSGFEHCG